MALAEHMPLGTECEPVSVGSGGKRANRSVVGFAEESHDDPVGGLSEASTGGAVGASGGWVTRQARLRAKRLEADCRGASLAAGMALVKCYADLILNYWEAQYAAGRLDTSRPLSVLEWGAGTGRFAFRLLRELNERLKHSVLSRARVKYVACESDPDAVRAMLEHPSLQALIQSRELLVQPLGATENAIDWDSLRTAFLNSATPLVVIANEVFRTDTQDLVGILNGKIFDARVETATQSADDSPQVVWTERSGTGEGPECSRTRAGPGARQEELAPLFRDRATGARRELLSAYSGRLDDVPVLIPTGALEFIDACHQASAGEYLLLAVDVGIDTQWQIREGVYRSLTDDLPLNFDALARYQRALGARTWNSSPDSEGHVFHVAICTAQRPTLRLDRAQHASPRRLDLLTATVSQLQQSLPGDFDGLLHWCLIPEDVTCERMLALVRLSQHDPRVMHRMIEPLLAKLDTLTVGCCKQWRDALERVWENFFPLGGEEAFAVDMATVAMHVEHWGVARKALTVALALIGDSPDLLSRLSYCEASTGRVLRALELIRKARVLCPDSDGYRKHEGVLRARVEDWRAEPGYRFDDSADPELTLEPLGPEHADRLLFQYRDPQIGIMTRLPVLDSMDATLAWLDDHRRDPGRAVYAVMHASWGFVGVVSLHAALDRAYFYFWIGTDYQGSGLGCRAARLLFRQADALGVRELFTSVYPANQRSLNALSNLRFRRIEACGRFPDDDLIFFCRPVQALDGGSAGARDRLRELLKAIDSPIELT